MIQRAKASRYVDRIWKSYTRPYIIKGEDGKKYVVKIPPNGDTTSNLKEYLGARLADYYGLSVLEIIEIEITQRFIDLHRDNLDNHIGPGKYAATLFQEHIINIPRDKIDLLQTDNITNQNDIPKFIAFDVFIDNPDRHAGNYMLIDVPNKTGQHTYYLFDHGHIFGGLGHKIIDGNKLLYRLTAVNWNLNCATWNGFEKAVKYIVGRYGAGVMTQFLNDAPMDWKTSYGEQNIKEIEVALKSRDGDKMLTKMKDNPKICNLILGGI